MKKISFFSLRVMLLVALCCFSFRAMADEVTVYDGTATSEYVPVYGNWADSYVRSQCIYSADDLSAAGIEPGAAIQSVTFYLYSTADVAWTSLWDVNVVETTTTSLASGFVTLEEATTVLQGAVLSAVKPTLTLEFEAPYIYQGGNLVLDVRNQAPGNYSFASFYGTSVSGGSRAGYSYSGTNSVTGYDYSFAPKTTFRYEASSSSCPRPDFINVEDITAYSARLNWGGTASSYELTVNGVTTIEEGTSKDITLNPYTRYTVDLRAICDKGDTSRARSINFVSAKTCLAPDTVYVSDATIDGNATLNWGGDASMYFLFLSVDGNIVFNDRTGANSFNLTGLASGMHNLEVMLSAQCGPRAHEQSDTLALAINLDIPCLPSQLPWSEGFENMPLGNSYSAAPACWSMINANEGSYPYAYVNNSSSYVHSGSKSLYFESSNSKDAYVLFPVFETGLAGAELHFWYRNEGTSESNGTLGIGYLTDANDESSFVLIQNCEKTTTLTEVVVTVPAEMPADARLAFRYAHGSAQNYYAAVDDITIEVASSCAKVQNVRLGEIGMNDVQILWDAAEGAAEYAVVVTAGETTLFNQTVQDTVITIQNLYASTVYSLAVSVTTLCSATESSYPRTANLTFTTACGPITQFPWTEDFESMPLGSNSDPAPACWDFVNVNEGTYPYVFVNNSSSYVHSGSRSLYFQSSNSKYAYVFLPEFGVNLSNAEISFWYKDESTSSSGYLDLGYMHEGEFVSLASYTRNTSWTAAVTALTELPEGERLCFRYGGASNNYYLGIDDISIRILSSCPRVEDIYLASVSQDSVVIAWPAVEGAQEYHVDLMNGNAPAVVTDTFFVINNLQGGPIYSIPVAVATVCTDGALSDALQKTLSFVAAPWSEDFESYNSNTVPSGWDNSASTSSSLSDYPHYLWGVYRTSGNNTMRMHNYSARAGETSTLSPLVILPADAPSVLNFDYTHNSNGGDMIVSISEDNGASFSVLGTYSKGSGSSYSDPGNMTPVSISLESYIGKSVIFKFEAYCNWGSGAIFVDNIYVGTVPTCFPVQEIHLVDGSVTESAATLAWTPAEEGGENFRVIVVNAEDTLFNGLVNDTVLALTELVPATNYSLAVSVQTICAEEDAANAVAANITFSTNCVVATAPYFTSFEEGRACWDIESGISVSTYYYTYEGSYALRFATTNEVCAVLPEIDNLNGNRFSMFYRNEGDGTYQTSGYFLMGYMLDEEFVALSDSFPQVFEMTEAFVDFEGVPAGARAAIKYYGATTSYWSAYVDNVEVAPIPTCFPASNLRVDSVGRDFAILAWTPGASEQGYNLTITQWGDTLANTYVQDTVFVLSGLQHSYPYYQVRVDITSVCGDDDLAKTYSSTITFTTECGVNVIDYYTPFRAWFSGADLKSNCYNTYGTGNAEGWVVGKTDVDLGEYTTYNYATVPYATDTVRVTSVLELPLIGLTAGKQYELNFWAKGTDYQTDDSIAVYINDELVMDASANEIGGEWVNLIDTISGDGESLVSFRYSSFFGYSFSIAELVIRELYEFAPSTFEDVNVDENGLFRPYNHSGYNSWESGSQTFATYVDDSYGTPYYSDITVSALKDSTFTNDFSAGYDMKSACASAAEGDHYAVWYNNWYSEGFSVYFRQPEVVSGMYVTNNTYVLNSILNGDSYAKKFETGDWFKLTVNGFNYADYDGDGKWEIEKVASVDFYLADFRDSLDYRFAFDWMWLDLTALGEVGYLGFELSSSDTGDWGMNTPAYFCFDNLGGQAPEVPADYRHIINVVDDLKTIVTDEDSVEKFFQDNQVRIRKNGKTYTILGQQVK